MNWFSEKNVFIKGLILVIYLPLLIPHFLIQDNINFGFAIILSLLFVWMLSVYARWVLHNLKKIGNVRIYVLIYFSTIVINFIASFFISRNTWMIYLLSIWTLVITIYFGSIVYERIFGVSVKAHQ